MNFSFIIPVYNRPFEIDELLYSLSQQIFYSPFEIVIIEDGSTKTSKTIIEKYTNILNIQYLYKQNSGPGNSRNYGMEKAKGDYFIILDSDCIIPENYLNEIEKCLKIKYVDCFGGPDKALNSFTDIQKAINFTMTSFFTTGGIRGSSEKISKFQPRSFNMGLSKKAFESSGGFGNIHPGEDPDLAIRLWQLNYKTKLFSKAYVYHKRRINWSKFYIQIYKFGQVRPILDSWHPKYAKFCFFFPSIFLIVFIIALGLLIFDIPYLLYFYIGYFIFLGLISTLKHKNLKIGILSVFSTMIQFYAYGLGFLKSFFYVRILKRNPQKVFPHLFY